MVTIDEVWHVSVESLIGPPPPGLDVHRTRTMTDNVACVALVVVTTIVVAIRFFVLVHIQKIRPYLDDWLMLFNLVPLIALTAIACLGGERYGLGKHIWAVNIGPLIIGKKNLFIWLILYVFQLFMVKVSVLLFYRRILGMSWMITANVALSAAWALGSIIAILCGPAPISYFWLEYINPSEGHYRFPFYNLWVSNAASNVFTDVLIILVPVPVIWRQNMRVRQKLIVSVLMGLSIGVVVASVIRLHYLTLLDNNKDISYIMGIVFVWSTVEPCLGIMCACLPAVQPFVRFLLRIEYRAYAGGPVVGLSDGGFDFRPDLCGPDGKHDDKLRLTIEALVETEHDKEEREKLQQFLGPMFIRVQRDVELTVFEGPR
ncbi:hypothetical protein N7470_000289 [Penicillium chermesinum]|nr:hypothetical protein N7470_000289 [Penicillium chermesinum]